MNFHTPILLLAWKRPKAIKEVIDALRCHSPSNLYIACDGPNPSRTDEAELVFETRRVIDDHIDWPCSISKRYSDSNQGCKKGVSTAISWFFENCEQGIILEDDCVPHEYFLPYCQALLNNYKEDSRIWCISGSNFQEGRWRGDGSYYFSRYNHCWGWASWRRCWQHYDPEMRCWPQLRDSGYVSSLFDTKAETLYWTNIWDRLVAEGQPDTWDYQWTFTCLINSGLTILPNGNLVRNIGFGADATHTKGEQHFAKTWNAPPELVHPSFVLRDKDADAYTFDNAYNWARARRKSITSLPSKVARRIISLTPRIMQSAKNYLALSGH
jgi:hypothetical protein